MGTCTPESRLRNDDNPPPPPPPSPPLIVPPTEEDKDEFIPNVELVEEEFMEDNDEREEVKAMVARRIGRPSKDNRGSTTGGLGERREREVLGVRYEEVEVFPTEDENEDLVVVFALEEYEGVVVLPVVVAAGTRLMGDNAVGRLAGSNADISDLLLGCVRPRASRLIARRVRNL